MSTTPGATPKGAATRRRILDTAWDLSDAKGVETLLAGVTLRQVAEAADMSPSAVAYHFPTMRDLALGMIDRLAESLSLAPVDAVVPVVERADHTSMAELIREAMEVNWAVLTEPAEIEVQRRLDRCYAATGDERDGPEIRRALAAMADTWVGQIAQMYRSIAEQMDVHLIDPLTFDDMARAASCMTDGLLNAWMCDRSRVRDDLITDVLVALVSATVVPAPQHSTLEEVATRLPHRAAHSAAHLQHELTAGEVGSLFCDGVDGVTLTQVADRLHITPDEVVQRYGSVERVAALSFARHVPRVRDAAMRRLDLDARVAIADGIYELARCAREDRHCALALVHARHRAAVGSTCGPDPRIAVPLDDLLATPIAAALATEPRGAAELSSLAIDTVLTQSATRPTASVSTVTELALRLVPGA